MDTNQAPKTASLDFLDFLFTFVLGFGLVPEAIGLKGIMSEDWVVEGRAPNLTEWGEISVLALGLLTLTLSWFGYHASIQKKGILFNNRNGLARFQFDVVLILLYGVILINYRRFDAVLIMVSVTFAIFVVWDLLKAHEYGETYLARTKKDSTNGHPLERESFRREIVTLIWTGAMLGVLIMNRAIPNVLLWSLVAIAISVLYRVNKLGPIGPIGK